jgi:hypothetical protein
LADQLNDEQKSLLNELLPLNIEARYPSHKDKLAESLTEKYCADLVIRTVSVNSFLDTKFAF